MLYNVTYFDSFGVGHTPKEIKIFIGNKNIRTYIYRIQAYDSIIVNIFVLDLLISYQKVKVYSMQIYFFLKNIKRITKYIKIISVEST